jgi:hypothetical protein
VNVTKKKKKKGREGRCTKRSVKGKVGHPLPHSHPEIDK